MGLRRPENGPVGLEKEVQSAKGLDPVLNYGANLVISGYEPDQVRTIMDEFVENTFNRNMAPVIMKDFAASAPAFGMVGTLVGLIIMLGNMGGSPEDLGAGWQLRCSQCLT